MKILVTGATGFVGFYMLEYLRDNGVDFYGTYFNEPFDDFKNIFSDYKKFTSSLDLKDKNAVRELIANVNPDAIIHLAALASPNDSWDILEEMLTNNMLSQLNILEAVRNVSPKIKVITVSSGQVYGAVKPNEIPLTEEHSIKPNNPYASSKVFQETLSTQYFYNYGIPTVILRPLNHIGPRQTGNFAIPSFVKQIVDIEKGLKEPIIKVGNLDAKRDFLDVRDVCEAYYLAVIKALPGEAYNLGSGKAYRMKEILEILISYSKVDIKIEVDKNLLRPSDMPILCADHSKFNKATGWEPKYKIEETLKDILEYWRKK
jgi:GDP-4-dehydro-6-deoxy-D-mannose reductase